MKGGHVVMIVMRRLHLNFCSLFLLREIIFFFSSSFDPEPRPKPQPSRINQVFGLLRAGHLSLFDLVLKPEGP